MTLLAVPCEGANVLALFDEDGTALGEIAVGRNPVHATLAAERLFVATMGERSVTVVERDGRVDRIETGVLGPAHLESTGQLVLVPCSAGDAVAVIDPQTASMEGRVPTGAEPHDVAVIEGGSLAGSRTDGVLTLFEPGPLEVKARFEVPDPDTARIQGVDTEPSDTLTTSAYAIDQGNDRVLHGDQSGIKATATVGSNPYEATVTPGRVYVPSRGSDTVYEFVPDLSESVVYETAAGPEGVVIVGGKPWVYHRGASVLQSLAGQTVSLPAPALAAAELPSGRVLLSHYDDHLISLVDIETRTVEWTTETPAYPFGSVVV